MHHLVLERWSRGSGPLHARDAGYKLVTLVVLLVCLATTPGWNAGAALAFAAILAAGVVVSGLPPLSLAVRAAGVLPFVAVFSALSYWSGDQQRAAALLVKSYLSALAVLLVVATTPLAELLRGMERLGVPRLLVWVAQFLYRYLFVIVEQAQHMRLSAECRAAGGRAPRKVLFRAAAGALAVLFARSYSRAEAIHRAMLARGFRERLPILDPKRAGWKDAALLGATAALAVGARLAFGGRS